MKTKKMMLAIAMFFAFCISSAAEGNGGRVSYYHLQVPRDNGITEQFDLYREVMNDMIATLANRRLNKSSFGTSHLEKAYCLYTTDSIYGKSLNPDDLRIYVLPRIKYDKLAVKEVNEIIDNIASNPFTDEEIMVARDFVQRFLNIRYGDKPENTGIWCGMTQILWDLDRDLIMSICQNIQLSPVM